MPVGLRTHSPAPRTTLWSTPWGVTMSSGGEKGMSFPRALWKLVGMGCSGFRAQPPGGSQAAVSTVIAWDMHLLAGPACIPSCGCWQGQQRPLTSKVRSLYDQPCVDAAAGQQPIHPKMTVIELFICVVFFVVQYQASQACQARRSLCTHHQQWLCQPVGGCCILVCSKE